MLYRVFILFIALTSVLLAQNTSHSAILEFNDLISHTVEQQRLLASDINRETVNNKAEGSNFLIKNDLNPDEIFEIKIKKRTPQGSDLKKTKKLKKPRKIKKNKN